MSSTPHLLGCRLSKRQLCGHEEVHRFFFVFAVVFVGVTLFSFRGAALSFPRPDNEHSKRSSRYFQAGACVLRMNRTFRMEGIEDHDSNERGPIVTLLFPVNDDHQIPWPLVSKRGKLKRNCLFSVEWEKNKQKVQKWSREDFPPKDGRGN